MVGPGKTRVVLELDPGEPISGTIRGRDGNEQPFRGWLELTSRLEGIRGNRTPVAARLTKAEREPSGGSDARGI